MTIQYLEPWVDAFAETTPESRTPAEELSLTAIAAAEVKTPVIPMGNAIGIEVRSEVVGAAIGGANDLVLSTYASPLVENPAGEQVASTERNGTESIEAIKTFDLSTAAAQGAELITNGAFAADTDWTKSSQWAIAAGVALRSAGSPKGSIHQALVLDASAAAKQYLFKVKQDTADAGFTDWRVWLELSAATGHPLTLQILRSEAGTSLDGTVLAAIVRLPVGMVSSEIHIEEMLNATLVVDDVSMKLITAWYHHTFTRRLDQLASGVVLGFAPAADFGSNTFVRCAYRRWTYRL